jgi:hypothetical protein
MAAVGLVGVTERVCSNILTREVVGGIGVSSVALGSCLWFAVVPAAERGSKLSHLF